MKLVVTRCEGCGQMRGVNGSTCKPHKTTPDRAGEK